MKLYTQETSAGLLQLTPQLLLLVGTRDGIHDGYLESMYKKFFPLLLHFVFAEYANELLY